MGIRSFLFGKPRIVDKVSPEIRRNTEEVATYMESQPKVKHFGDFVFEYLYTTSEAIDPLGTYGSVIYIRVESPIHNVLKLDVDFTAVQRAIDEHQSSCSLLPNHLSKTKTRWLYFNMTKIFRAC